MSDEMIAILDDEPEIIRALAAALEEAGFRTMGFRRAANFQAALPRLSPAVCLVDLSLPDQDGLAVVYELAQAKGAAIMIISGRGRVQDKVAGLELGADDYICKPVDRLEVVLRAKIALRRICSHEESGRRIELKGLSVEANPDRVIVDNSEITLTPTEFRLLLLLVDRPNKVQSRQSLLAEVWGMQSYLETRTVDMHIRRLRRKLGTAAHHIETVRGAGYRFSVSEPALEDKQQ